MDRLKRKKMSITFHDKIRFGLVYYKPIVKKKKTIRNFSLLAARLYLVYDISTKFFEKLGIFRIYILRRAKKFGKRFSKTFGSF